jgi:hypothetical protein
MGSEVSISPGLSGVSYRSTLPPVEQPPQAQDVSGVPGSQGGKPSVGTSIPKDGEDERPSLKTFLEGAIGERLKEHGDEGTKVPSDGKWHKESEADKYEAKKQQAEDYLAGKATPGVPGQKVGADFGDMFRLGRHPTLQGIAQHAQQKFSGLNPQNMTRKNDAEDKAYIQSLHLQPDEEKAALETIETKGIPIASKGIPAAVDSLAAGGSLGEAGVALGGSALLGVAGGVGLAVGAGKFAIDEAESQRSANVAYQSVEGGSNAHGFLERLRGEGFGLSQMGVMGMGQANELFTGVTDLGLQGGARQNALDFATTNYKNLGMSIAESLDAISISAKAGHSNLSQLAGVLDNVTQSAATASVNTDVARQNFLSMFQANVGSGMSTTASQTVAGAMQNIFSGLGQSGQGISFQGGNQGAQAAALHMSLSSFQQAIAGNSPGAARILAAGQEAFQTQIASGVVAGIPGIQSLAAQAADKNQGQASAFGRALNSAGIPNQEIESALTAAGYTIPPGTSNDGLYDLFAGMVSGKGNPETSVTNTQAQSALSQARNSNPQLEESIGGHFAKGSLGPYWVQGTIQDANQVGYANVKSYMQKNGISGSNILQDLYEHGAEGILDIHGKKTAVMRALADQSDLAQIQRGAGITYTGGPKGKTTSLSAWGGQYEKNGPGSGPTSTNNQTATSNGVTVTISPSPQMAQWFQTSIASSNGSALQSTPSQSPMVLASGN